MDTVGAVAMVQTVHNPRTGQLEIAEARPLHWTKAARIDTGDGKGERWNPKNNEGDITPEMVARMYSGLPAIVRRTQRQRYQKLVRELVDEGIRSVKAYGYPVWPKSVQDELTLLGWKQGDPDLRGQVEALAGRLIEKGARKQQAADAHRSAIGWHGHYD